MVETSAGGAANRVSESLKSAFDRNDYYEAHQIYKSINFRYLRQKKYSQLADILYDGAMKLLDLGLDQSGIDVAKMYGDLLDKGDIPVTSDTIGKVAVLYRAIPSKHENERSNFLNSAMTWSKKRNPEIKTGHLALHSAIAQVLVQEEKYDGAVYHYVRSLDPVRCLSTLQLIPETSNDVFVVKEKTDEDSAAAEDEEEWEDEEEDEVDGSKKADQRLLGLAVLDFLALERLDLAKQLFGDFISQHRDAEMRNKCYNFRIPALISALLSLCAKGETTTAEEFGLLQNALRNIYAGSSRVDKLMTRIGQTYCHLKAASNSPWAGLLSGMFAKEGATAATDSATPSASTSGVAAKKTSDVAKNVNLHSDLDFD